MLSSLLSKQKKGNEEEFMASTRTEVWESGNLWFTRFHSVQKATAMMTKQFLHFFVRYKWALSRKRRRMYSFGSWHSESRIKHNDRTWLSWFSRHPADWRWLWGKFEWEWRLYEKIGRLELLWHDRRGTFMLFDCWGSRNYERNNFRVVGGGRRV